MTVATLEAGNGNKAIVTPMAGCGEIEFWRESGVRLSVLCWCVWLECGLSHREDVFTLNLVDK
jgi:hypothetical protein